jgi:hypothetical protein
MNASSVSLSGELIKALIAFVFGTVIGGMISHWFSLQRQRTDFTVKLMDAFFAQYGSIAEVKGLLYITGRVFTPAEENTVRKVGDWFELVALMCTNGVAQLNLIRAFGLVKELETFSRLVSQHPQFEEAVKAWDHMQALQKNN